jgi:hypothetical protein
MDHFKFELIRANAAQEIMHCMSVKFEAKTALGLLKAFLGFVENCGYDKESLIGALEMYQEEGLLHTFKEHCLDD